MILVTGATGFVGSELVKQLLKDGFTVRAVKRAESIIPQILKDQSGIEWVEADLLNYFSLQEAFEGVKQVYHCGAFISFNPTDKKKLHKINVEGTAHIVDLCLEHNIEKLVHVSSVAALGEAKPGQLITENHRWEFNGKQHGYSISKHESEMEIWRGIAEGLNAVIVNPSLIIGKNAGIKGSGQLFEIVRRGLKFYTSGSVGLVDVEDVARCMIMLMQSDIRDDRFLINAENWAYKELFTEIASYCGVRPPLIKAKPWMISLAWWGALFASLLTGKKYGLTKHTAESAFKNHAYSNQKIQQATGINFKPIKKTIQEICQSLKENHCEQKLLHY